MRGRHCRLRPAARLQALLSGARPPLLAVELQGEVGEAARAAAAASIAALLLSVSLKRPAKLPRPPSC
jgi:TctA family transporter